MTVATGEVCRLVVCGPDRQVEVAVPAHVLIADLLPALLHHLGDNLADTGLLHGGWVLQRLGSTPFDDDSTIASLGLHDGDTVHLRPRAEQIPPVDFDDLIDGVASGVHARAGRWRPEMARWACLGLLAVLLCLGLAMLAMEGPPRARAVTAAGLAVGCLTAALMVATALGDRAFALVFGIASTGYAGLGGLLAPSAMAGSGAAGSLAGPQIFSGAVAVLAAASIGVALVNQARPSFTAVLVIAVTLTGGVALVTFLPLTVGDAAAALAVITTVLGTTVPVLAFRLAGLRLAPLPTAPEHLQEDLDPVPSEQLLAAAAAADRYMTALYVGLAVPAAVALVLLSREDGWAPVTLLSLAALVRLLAARPMTSGWHRLAMTTPAVAGLVGAALSAVADQPQSRPLLAAVIVGVGAVALLALARLLPGRRLMPYWGRIGDLTQTLAAVAMFPILFAVLDLYSYARAIGG